MSKPKDAKTRKQAQRYRDAALGIQRVEVRLSIREREQLETLRRARAGSGEPYSADEYISTLLRRDWERWQQQPRIPDDPGRRPTHHSRQNPPYSAHHPR
ncbi:hypothetical protein ACYHQE_003130 [Aeromonas salmonicida]